MAAGSNSGIHPQIREAFALGAFNWTTQSIRWALMGPGYVYDPTTQATMADVPADQVIQTSEIIANLTGTDGFLSGDTTGFGVVSATLLANSLLMFLDGATTADQTLVAFMDTPDCPGFPAALDGLNYFVYKNLNYGGWYRL